MNSIPLSSGKKFTISIVGLGYVGLPLAVEFGKKVKTLGLDQSTEKVDAYNLNIDPTGEVSSKDLKASTHLKCYSDPMILKKADFMISSSRGEFIF